MPIKHKVLKDFQFLTPDKKIIILKAKSTIVDYKYVTKTENLTLEREVLDNNPDFFSPIDWKEELNTYIKQNKIPQPAVLTKKLIPFIEEMFVVGGDQKQAEIEKVVEKIVEVPVEKIVEKIVEVPVEKIVEKIVEKNVGIEREIELETALKKIEIRETKLKEELESVHLKEMNLNQKEKEINSLKEILDLKETDIKNETERLENLKSDLENRESKVSERETAAGVKESELNQYVLKSILRSKVQELKIQGWDMTMTERMISSL